MSRFLDLARRSGLTPTIGAGGGSSTELHPWSSPATWAYFGVPVPQADDSLIIPAGETITLDTVIPSVNSITVNGHLVLSTAAESVMKICQIIVNDGGVFSSGTEDTPNPITKHRRVYHGDPIENRVLAYTHTGMISTGNDGNANDDYGSRRGLMVMPGGQYLIYGGDRRLGVHEAKLQGNHSTGAKALTIDRSVRWFAGDEIVVFSTRLPQGGVFRSERFILTADTNDSPNLALDRGLGHDRWGLLQYFTDTDPSLSLSPGTWSTKKYPWMPSTLDTRAVVMNMTRDHRVEPLRDDAYTEARFGFHEMFMIKPGNGKVVIKNQEYKDGGQGGALGRYPWHFHAGSIIPNTSTHLGSMQAGQAVIEDVSVNGSLNRAFSIHATDGVVVNRMKAWGILGAGAFFEEGSEQDNTLQDCIVAKTDDPGIGWRLKAFDALPPALWLPNGYNRIIRMHGHDTKGQAFWYGAGGTIAAEGYVGGCWGLSKKIDRIPTFMPMLQYQDNTWSCSQYMGKTAGMGAAYDEQGNTEFYFEPNAVNHTHGDGSSRQYATSDGRIRSESNYEINPLFDGDTVFLCDAGGYQNSFLNPRYLRQVFADNGGKHFQGVTIGGDAQALLVRKSNNPGAGGGGAVGFDTYHGTLRFFETAGIGYEPDTPSYQTANGYQFDRAMVGSYAVSGARDIYLSPLEVYSKAMTVKHVGEGPAFVLVPGPMMSQYDPWLTWNRGNTQYVVRGGNHSMAFYDYEGDMAGRAGEYIVLDHPWVTYGASSLRQITGKNGAYLANLSTPTQYVGIAPDSQNAEVVATWLPATTFARCRPTDLLDAHLSDTGVTGATAGNLIAISKPLEAGNAPNGGSGYQWCIPTGGACRLEFTANPSQAFVGLQGNFVAAYERGLGTIFGLTWTTTPPSVFRLESPGYNQPGVGAVSSAAELVALTKSGYWLDTAGTTGHGFPVLWCKFVQNPPDGNNSSWYLNNGPGGRTNDPPLMVPDANGLFVSPGSDGCLYFNKFYVHQ